MKRKTIHNIVVLVVIVAIIGLFSYSLKEETVDQPQIVTTPTITPTQIIISAEEHIERIILETLDDDADPDITITKFPDPEAYVMTIRFMVSDNLNNEMIKNGIWIDTTDLLKALYTSGHNIENVNIVVNFPLIDKYGNKSVGPIVKLNMSEETAEKINWENFLWTNLPDVVDSYWQHQDLSK